MNSEEMMKERARCADIVRAYATIDWDWESCVAAIESGAEELPNPATHSVYYIEKKGNDHEL